MVYREKWTEKLIHWLFALILIIAAASCLIPIINTIAISFSDKSIAAAGDVFLLPKKFTLSSYTIMLKDANFGRAFGISVVRVILGGSLNFLFTVLMAYPLSKRASEFKGRNVYMWIMVFCMMFQAGIIPLYITISKLKLINTIWALVLPGAVPIFNVILLMNFFRSIPKSLEEAALMDGASPWYILARIFIPISLPALATVTLFSIVGHWNSFFDGLIYLNSPKNYPLQTYIRQLIIPTNTMNITDPVQLQNLALVSNKTINAAKIMVSMIPIMVIYPFLQKYFVTGILLGSVKE